MEFIALREIYIQIGLDFPTIKKNTWYNNNEYIE